MQRQVSYEQSHDQRRSKRQHRSDEDHRREIERPEPSPGGGQQLGITETEAIIAAEAAVEGGDEVEGEEAEEGGEEVAESCVGLDSLRQQQTEDRQWHNHKVGQSARPKINGAR